MKGKRSLALFLVLWMLAPLFLSPFLTVQPAKAATAQFNLADNSKCYYDEQDSSTSWAAAHSGLGAWGSDSYSWIRSGCYAAGSYWDIFRAAVQFDTSSLSGKTVTSATLYVAFYAINIGEAFSIILVDGTPCYFPMASDYSDYGRLLPQTTSYGSISMRSRRNQKTEKQAAT